MFKFNQKSIGAVFPRVIVAAIFGFLPLGVFGNGDNLVVYIDGDSLPLSQTHRPAIFSEGNFNPGDTVARWISATNNSGQEQRIAIEAIQFSDPIPSGDLSRALEIIISQNGSDLYGGTKGSKTLYDFYSVGETYLSNLPTGQTARYDLTVSFPPQQGNDWQGKTTNFSVLVGFQHMDSQGKTNGGGGSGGGAGGQRALIITDEAAINVTSNTAVITWNTNYESTSWVVFGLKSGGPYSLDLSKEHYGYPNSSEKNADKVISHSVAISGLSPGTEYYYRCVSHGSLAVSLNRTFTTLAAGQVAGAETENWDDGDSQDANSRGRIFGHGESDAQSQSKPGQVAGAETEDFGQDEAAPEIYPDEIFAAEKEEKSSKEAEGCDPFPWWLFAVLSAICAIAAFDDEKKRRWRLAGALIALVAAIIIYFLKPCLPWYIFLLAILLVFIVDNLFAAKKRP